MKKIIITTAVAACLALCAVVWPQREVAEETPKPTQEIAVDATETPAVAPKEEIKVLPQTEEENADSPQPELPVEMPSEPEPEPMPTEMPVAAEKQPIPEPTTTPQPAPEPTPVQTTTAPQPDNIVYVEGFGWLESQGEGTVIHDDMMYENGNKVGSMGPAE